MDPQPAPAVVPGPSMPPGPVDPRPFAVRLPDGSSCRVDATGPSSSVVARVIANRPVWAEHVVGGDHPTQIEAMVAAMAAAPEFFVRFGSDPFASSYPPISAG